MSTRRKSRQFSKERTFSIPPAVWWTFLLVGIAGGFIFGIGLIILLLMLFSMMFQQLAILMGSALITFVVIIIILIIARGYIMNFSALGIGILIGIVIAFLWVTMGWWSPVPPAQTDLPTLPETVRLFYG